MLTYIVPIAAVAWAGDPGRALAFSLLIAALGFPALSGGKNGGKSALFHAINLQTFINIESH
ncbi:hypothetical protein BDD14_2575 [Edaphobacter modestus]|uniref:Uncharacterized protein n=1 Tax=Edaphobacter modestus TaxID=388466 RepID=A0A4Q7YTE9_9BACT|nr:hypothetical protein BDD14_2575 [Edaphobacter modestus]